MTLNLTLHTLPRIGRVPKYAPINYDFVDTRFGRCLLGAQDNKICHLSFQDGDIGDLTNLKADWPSAVLNHDPDGLRNVANDIFKKHSGNVDVLLRGTDLQVTVWKELLNIKEGSKISYEEVANRVGKPNAIRAVANAVAKNKVAYLIPCHRVVHKSGKKNKYRWGVERKEIMLDYEGAS